MNEGLYKFLPNRRCSTAFSYPPPPPSLVAQTELSSDLKSVMEGPQGKLFGIFGAIFKYVPPGLRYGGGWVHPMDGKNRAIFFSNLEMILKR